MEYYRLLDNLNNPTNKWRLGGVISEANRSVWDYITVSNIISDEIIKVTLRKKGTPADINMADFDVIIVSRKVKDLMDMDEVQFIAVTIEGLEEWGEYFLLYIKNECNCVDEKNSIFDKYEANDPIRPDKAGQYKAIYQLIIETKNLKNLNIFRVKGYNVAIIISGDLKQKMDRLNISGALYQKVTL